MACLTLLLPDYYFSTQDLRFDQYFVCPRQLQSWLNGRMRLLLDTWGLDRRTMVSGLCDYIHGLGSDRRDKSMMALAHKLCLDNVEGCHQRM